MVIILEGCDGAGKSTLARKLGKHYEFDVIHSDKMNYWEEHKLISSKESNVIFDRLSHLSDQIYGPILRDEHNSPVVKHRKVFDKMLLDMNGVVILCESDLETTCQGWKKNLDSKGPENWEDFSRIYFGYKNLKTDLPVITFDWKKDDYLELTRQIELAAQTNMEKTDGN